MTLGQEWFTEVCEQGGSAFSLQLGEKLHEEQTPFQKIEIYQTRKFGKLMTIDGFVMLTGRDNFIYHEMMAHPVLFSHPNPRKVLIVGGGDCGTLTEVLKHPQVQTVWQVDIDERVTRLSEQYFPELCRSNHDSRVRMCFEDAVKWIQQAEHGTLDVIIIDSTDPIGPGEGLFTEAFYRDCYQALNSQGLIVQQSESPLYHAEQIIQPMHRKMLNGGFHEPTLLLFPQCCYPSGWWSATLAGKSDVFPQKRRVIDKKTISTRYYNASIHEACLALPEYLIPVIKNQ